jgi:Ca-activated chloride channel family protein
MKNALLCLFLCGSLTLTAQVPQPIIFIFDASGSMWGQVDNATKISTAKEVLTDLTGGLPADQPLGLVAYGHRREADCSDIETLLPPGNTDQSAFAAAVSGLTPLGRTPLARSATLVIDQLRTSGQPATIILLTDGVETCEGDLCELVAAAKAEGIDFVLHIIGFDLGEEDRLPLACAARAGEGLYLDAEDGEQLASALKQTTQLTVDEGDATLEVSARKDGALRDAVIQVFVAGTETEVAASRTYADEATNPARFRLPAGHYDIRASLVGERALTAQWRRSFRVPAEEITRADFDFTTGQAVITVTANDELHDATLRIYPTGEDRQVYSSRTYQRTPFNPHAVDLAPGVYDIRIGSVTIKGENEHAFEQVTIEPGKTTELAHNFSSGTLQVKVTINGALWDCIVAVSNTDGSVDQNRTYNHEGSNPTTFILTPGIYTVNVKALRSAGGEETTFDIEVPAGGQASKEINW